MLQSISGDPGHHSTRRVSSRPDPRFRSNCSRVSRRGSRTSRPQCADPAHYTRFHRLFSGESRAISGSQCLGDRNRWRVSKVRPRRSHRLRRIFPQPQRPLGYTANVTSIMLASKAATSAANSSNTTVALDRCFDRYAGRVEALARDAIILEYGCGEAAKGIRLAAVARRVEGIDISDNAIENGRAQVERRGLDKRRPVRAER